MKTKEYQPVIIPDNNLKRTKHLFADLHTHSNLSDGLVSAEKLVDQAIIIGLNALAVTDHDTLAGSDNAANYVSKNCLPIEIIRGMEISSQDGHVLAYNIDVPIPSNLPLSETIREIHAQSGLVVIPHPHSKIINGVSLTKVQSIINSREPELYLDGIEIYNAAENKLTRLDKTKQIFKPVLAEVIQFIKKNKNNKKLGAIMANSDTHTSNVGHGITKYSNCYY